MSWVVDLWSARYRGSIVFGGALLIIALIKLTSLLPEAYYFRFSTLLSSDGSPFIVAPPGVTYQRLCAIIRKNRLADSTFSVETSCPAVADENATTIPLYGQQNIDVIYRAVLSNDETMRRAAEASVASLAITPPTEADVQSTLQTSTNLETASTLISDRYRQAASEAVAIAIIKKLDSAFSSLPIEQAAVPPTAIPTDAITGRGRDAFVKALKNTNDNLSVPPTKIQVLPMTKKKLDEISQWLTSREDLVTRVVRYYSDQVGDAYAARFLENLRHEGIDPVRDKDSVDRTVQAEGLKKYLTSVAVRLAPVLLFGLIIGLVFGAQEISSAALAGALAAFLLVWPVVLMWEQVVNYNWQDKRHIFFAFYIVYVFSFFLAARFAAGAGALVRRLLPLRRAEPIAAIGSGGGNFAIGVARDLLVGVVVNVLFYVGNALITVVA